MAWCQRSQSFFLFKLFLKTIQNTKMIHPIQCTKSSLKWCFFFINFVWMASSVYNLGLILYLSTPDAVVVTIPEFKMILIIRTVFYVASFAHAFWGCYGAIKENTDLVMKYAVGVLGILLIHLCFIGPGILGYLWINLNVDSYQSYFDNYWTDYSARASINHLQSTKLCCGSTGPSYWDKFPHQEIPWSCCGSDESLTCTRSTAFTTGCGAMLHTEFEQISASSFGLNMGLIVVELVCFTFAAILVHSLNIIQKKGTIYSAEMTCSKV